MPAVRNACISIGSASVAPPNATTDPIAKCIMPSAILRPVATAVVKFVGIVVSPLGSGGPARLALHPDDERAAAGSTAARRFFREISVGSVRDRAVEELGHYRNQDVRLAS